MNIDIHIAQIVILSAAPALDIKYEVTLNNNKDIVYYQLCTHVQWVMPHDRMIPFPRIEHEIPRKVNFAPCFDLYMYTSCFIREQNNNLGI